MAKKTRTVRKTSRRTASRRAPRRGGVAASREASTASYPMSAVAKLATHPENIIATLNAHAALLEMLVAQVHVLAVGGPGVAAMRAAKETLRRLMSMRVTETLQRPAGRSKAEYDLSVQLAKIEVRDIVNGAIERLGRQVRGAAGA